MVFGGVSPPTIIRGNKTKTGIAKATTQKRTMHLKAKDNERKKVRQELTSG